MKLTSWNQAAIEMSQEIFDFYDSRVFDGSISEIRKTLDEYIDAHPSLSKVQSYVAWRGIGGASLAAAIKNSIFTGSLIETHSELVETLVRKQTDYGHENISRFGTTGLMVRFHDKVARLENLESRGTAPKNESLRDNYLDLLGYSTIALMWESGNFLLPLD